MEQLDQEIQKMYSEVKLRERLLRKLKKMSADILSQELMLEELKAIKFKEKSEFESLNNISFKSLFTLILGEKTEQLEIERQEFLWAKLNYLASKRRIEDAKKEKAAIEKKLSKYNLSEKHLRDLLIRKERRTKKTVKEFRKYQKLERKVRNLHQFIVEVSEAQLIGYDLLPKIEKLKKQLTKFRYKVENVEDLSLQIDHDLRIFFSELDDINDNFELNFVRHITIVKDFLKIFFDNLITDWVIAHDISSALKTTDNLIDRVDRIQRTLDRAIQTTLLEIDFYEQKKREYLLEE